MAVSRKPEAQPSLVPLGVALSVIAGGIAMYFSYPGAALIWIGLIISGFLARPPHLTGPKDPATLAPVVGNPGEAKKVAQYRFWVQARASLLMPKAPWPFAFSDLAALGTSLIVFTLPAVEPTPYMVWVNAIAAFQIVATLARVRREFVALDSEPMPATEVQAWVRAIGTQQKATASLAPTVVLGVGAGYIAWWWITSANWYLILPPAVAGVGVALLIIAATGHSAMQGAARKEWRETVEARETWKSRWAVIPKLKDGAPTLLTHTRVGEQGEGWIDTFRAGADGSAAWIPMPESVRPVLPPNTRISFLSTPECSPDGQEITPSRSAREFKVISWRGDETPDILDPATNQSVVAAWLHMVVSDACTRDSGAIFELIPLGNPQAIHADGSPHAVWMVEYTITDAGAASALEESMLHLARVSSAALGVEVHPFGTAFAIGPVMDPKTQLIDEELRQQIQEEEERERWGQKWKDMSSIQPPKYFPEYDETVEVFTTHSPTPITVEKRWFIGPNGLEVADYMGKITTEKLRTGLGTVQWATMGRIIRGGQTVPGGIAVYWSKEPVPRNPAEIEPGGRESGGQSRKGVRPSRLGSAQARVSDGAKWVITGQINEGFTMAKLAPPELVHIQPLTSSDSDIHIWDIDLRLHGGVTVAEVKRAREKIRLTLGAEWLRITESSLGARIAVGAPPTHPRVKWRNDTAREIAIRLDWEQAFLESKIMNTGAQVPTLLSLNTLPKNELVNCLQFKMPAGISISDVRAGREKLGGATENSFVDVRQGEKANEVLILAATESPMPDLARFDWDEVHSSHAVPFATGIEGEPLVFDPLATPHLLFLGDTGTGKSAALQTFLAAAIIRGWELNILDSVKGAADFKFLVPYASIVATDPFTVAAALKMIYAEVLRRKDLNKKYGTAKVSDIEGPAQPRHMIVMIDELLSAVTLDPVDRTSGDETEDELKDIEEKRRKNLAMREIGTILGRIAREARSAGVTILASSQSLTKDETEKTPGVFDVKKQAARVLLGKSNFGQRQGAFKNPEAAPELGESVPRGRGIYESSEGAPQIFQAWYDAPNHVESILEQIQMVRDPEPVTLTDEDLISTVAKVTVFGERIEASDEVETLGELRLDLSDLSTLAGDSIDDDDDIVQIPIISSGSDLSPEPDQSRSNEIPPDLVPANGQPTIQENPESSSETILAPQVEVLDGWDVDPPALPAPVQVADSMIPPGPAFVDGPVREPSLESGAAAPQSHQAAPLFDAAPVNRLPDEGAGTPGPRTSPFQPARVKRPQPTVKIEF